MKTESHVRYASASATDARVLALCMTFVAPLLGCQRSNVNEDLIASTSDLQLDNSSMSGHERGPRHSHISDCNDPEQHAPSCIDPSDAEKAALQARPYPYYVGHAEPAIEFFSSAPRSASDMQWRFSLPATDPSPTQNGSSVANFELFSTFWISLLLCDPTSNPYGPCTPVSDSNDPNMAGAALLELQFYPPGIARSQTSWSVSVTIDHVNDNNACNLSVPWRDITADGNPNSPSFLMSSGDDLIVTIKDTTSGLRIDVNDVTANRTGFMVASGANGFWHNAAVNKNRGSCSGNHSAFCITDADCPVGQTCSFCQTEPFDFHPMYSSATPNHVWNWAALRPNVAMAFEIGHWELCGNASCSILPDGDSDDMGCGPLRGVGGCQVPDLDKDGASYQAKWPDGNASHPAPIVIGSPNLKGIGPMSAPNAGTYAQPYAQVMFATTDGGPSGTAFYPFYSIAQSGQACRLNFGNDISGSTTNDFSKASQYGQPIMANPCYPDLSWLVAFALLM